MARKNEPTAIVASAARLNPVRDKTHRKLVETRRAEWQERAQEFYENIPEVGYAVDYIGNAVSQIRLFVAEKQAPGEKPAQTTNTTASDTLERLRSPLGGHSDILREIAMNLMLPGECYLVGIKERVKKDLVGRPVLDEQQRPILEFEESWDIKSKNEVEVKGKKTIVSHDDKKIELTDEDFILRIWIPHPLESQKAYSPMRRVQGACDELLRLERLQRLIDKSRAVSAGVLFMPESARVGTTDPTTEQAGEGAEQEDPFIKEFADAMEAAITDEDSPAALVPITVYMKDEALGKVQHITFDRKVEGQEIERRTNKGLQRVAQGLPLPPEIIKGLADVNHWTAWQIDESAYKHIDPLIVTMVDALTVGYLQPALEDAGIDDPDKYVVWYDPSALVVRPNRTDDAKDLHDRGIIKDRTLREATGFTDDDTPDDDELERRMRWKKAQPSDPPREDAQPIPDEPEPTDEPEEAVTAAATPARNPGKRLAEVDRTLKMRLEGALHAAMRRALERAGARVRTKGRKNEAIRASLEGVENWRLASHLGREAVTAAGATEDELLEGAFMEVEDDFRNWVEDAQRSALSLVPNLSPAERVTAERRQDEDRDGAWAWLLASLMATARTRLYDPQPEAPQLGEADTSISVPHGVIRQAVSLAGGNAVLSPASPVTRPAGGIGTGEVIEGLFRQRGMAVQKWEWVYGAYPRNPFPPHADLDGLIFDNFDSPELTNTTGWPDTTHYMPGDHDGCRCDADPVYVQVAEQAA